MLNVMHTALDRFVNIVDSKVQRIPTIKYVCM